MRSIRKISLLLFVGIIGFFATGCNGTTSIYGIEKSGKHTHHKKHPKKKKPGYNARYENRKPMPPGHKKKVYGDRSAKGHAPGHNKHKAPKHKKHHQKGKHK